MSNYTQIDRCRICGNRDLVSFLHLGEQTLTGVFPKSRDEKITKGPLELVKCSEEKDTGACGLVQLRHSYSLGEMYGENYGYRSGLNRSMVEHLQNKVKRILSRVRLQPQDLVIDIGSNDSTLLQTYPKDSATLVGIDPTGAKFKQYYPEHIHLIPDFFSAQAFKAKFGERKAKIITSIAMFYDLEDPTDFMRNIHAVLADDGTWTFEQSYMPTMLEANAYDTACHEHLEYYGLKQIKWMTDRVGLKILDVELNLINGGSFSITVAKKEAPYPENFARIEEILTAEKRAGLSTMAPYHAFRDRVFAHRDDLKKFIRDAKAQGKTVFGYGASTKGNVILQFCGITEQDLPCIAEVNPEKYGRFAPGTLIPIVSEKDAKAKKPDYFVVLPWHFRDNLLAREKDYMASGGKMFFPLPKFEVVSR
jgi:cyclopropane fatty-acyl-phospholipid synthase-like methyltransferase